MSLDCGENHLLMLDLEGYGELEEVKCEGQTREINAGEIGKVEDLGLSDPERVESFEQLGDAVVYEYRTGFRDVMMDVTLREFGLGGHGGCNFGTGILSMIVLWLFAKRR